MIFRRGDGRVDVLRGRGELLATNNDKKFQSSQCVFVCERARVKEQEVALPFDFSLLY